MFDTIDLVIHNIFTFSQNRYKKVKFGKKTKLVKLPPKEGIHDQLLFYLLNLKGGKLKYSSKSVIHAPDPDPVMGGSYLDPYKVFSNLYKDLDNNSEGIQYILKEKRFRSSNYDINIVVNPKSDCIRISFSIPKAVFGTNVLQMIPNITNKYYKGDKHNGFESMIDESYYFLITFIKDFLFDLFGGLPIDYKLVEIARLDFCFNQVFNSADSARRYITYLRHHKKKYSRDNGITFHNGNLRTPGRNSNFTIYQKGLDFDKHDKKEIVKRGGIPHVPASQLPKTLKKLSDLAYKTLRYEYQFKKGALSKFYKENVFRVSCKTHQFNLKHYKSIRAEKKRLEKKGETLEHSKELFRQKFRSAIETTTSLRLEVSEWDSLHNTFTTDSNHSLIPQESFVPRVAAFDIEVFRACVKKLHFDFLDFQVGSRPTYLKMREMVDEWNSSSTKEQKIPKNFKSWLKSAFRDVGNDNDRLFVSFLDDELKDGDISTRTYYNYKKYLKWIGISTNSVLYLDINAPKDFEPYHDYLLLEYDFAGNHELLNTILDTN